MIIKILIGAALLLDFTKFFRASAGGVTYNLCRPLFGLLYPHIGMVIGLVIWIIQILVGIFLLVSGISNLF